ncbi:hypothetical protein [Streptomyces parvulus]|uniref:hypothetical protein n=1 Tax=Streptomyces parvulus TaxID=146923 RepID=UPI0036838E49
MTVEHGTSQQPHQPSTGYTPAEIADARTLRADARARLDDIEARTQAATTPAEHAALGQETARAYGDYKSAGFILTEGAAG